MLKKYSSTEAPVAARIPLGARVARISFEATLRHRYGQCQHYAGDVFLNEIFIFN